MDKRLATASISVVPQHQPTKKRFPLSESSGVQTKESAIPALITGNHEVRVLRPDEYKAAALCLAEAFADDHTTDYFINTPDREDWSKEQKWDLHLSMMEYITYAHCLKGLATTVGPNYGAVALWMPPGQNMDDLLTVFRSGLWRLNYKLSAEGKRRFFNEFLPLLTSTKNTVLGPRDEDSWYLVYIGCRSSARGKGFARKLIDHVTSVADKAGQPCYLESSNEVNVRIYGKMGFEVVRKIYLQRCEKAIIELDIMVREPKESKDKRNSFTEKVSEVRTQEII